MDLVGRYFVENGVGFVVPDDNIIQDILIAPDATLGASKPDRGGAGHAASNQSFKCDGAEFWKCWVTIWTPAWGCLPFVNLAFRTSGYKVLTQIKSLTEQVPEEAKEGRVDLRQLPLMTSMVKMPAILMIRYSVNVNAAVAGGYG